MIRWGFFANAVSSARVVALPRVTAISALGMTYARSSCEIQSRICISPHPDHSIEESEFSKDVRISVLSFPSMSMISCVSRSHVILSRISWNILRAHWLPQIMRRCFLSVFHFTFHFSLFTFHSNTGWSICHMASHFSGVKYFFALSNPRNIFVASFPRIWFDLPGTVSDSWI